MPHVDIATKCTIVDGAFTVYAPPPSSSSSLGSKVDTVSIQDFITRILEVGLLDVPLDVLIVSYQPPLTPQEEEEETQDGASPPSPPPVLT
eukprot:CAMPEP_0118697160 /NCGR_PEP_ID=MMETSP0800-20121206/14321_1 /TAXON_ID=210618 ORGANISM="Striatella unipunctata, Strain CCMP2910" /NCGR_SAMPLE_ID=MMETSP0800 /ASSEMBLY_ACC=CAM_ASM_000638 /LENGTH=90 /DNA_ID=CAMNT_0006596499 /DNA_START=139 /DNA_END=409 /DNA_ORIENTATION=-